MPKPRKVKITESDSNVMPYLRLATKEELLKGVETDAKILKHIYDNPHEDYDNHSEIEKNISKNRVTKADIEKRINNPKIMERYERAHKVYVDKFLTPKFVRDQLKENNPEENKDKPGTYRPGDMAFGNAQKYTRISHVLVDPDRPNHKQIEILNGSAAKGIKRIVEHLMQANLSEIFTTDQDRYIDFAEEYNLAVFRNIGELDTLIGEYRIFKERGSVAQGLNPDSDLAKLYKETKDRTGLNDEQIQFILENERLFMPISTAGERLADYASPKSVILPDDPAHRVALRLNVVDPDNKFKKMKDGNIGVNYIEKYHVYGKDDLTGVFDFYSTYDNFEGHEIYKAVREHPEIIDQGFLTADYTAYVEVDGKGGFQIADKDQALKAYLQNPDKVQFILNDYGIRMEPERNKVREQARATLKDITEMEKALKDIYGSERNASDEFNALAKDIREAKAYAEKQCSNFLPSMVGLSRHLRGIQDKAQKYIDKKNEELKGKKPNKLRGKRMDFAAKILKIREPLFEKNSAEKLKDMMKKEQTVLRDVLTDMGGNVISSKYANHRAEIEKTLSRILAIETIREEVKKNGKNMDKSLIEGFMSEKTIDNSAQSIRNSEAFKSLVNDIYKAQGNDLQSTNNGIIDELDDVAASENNLYCATNGVHRVFHNLLERIYGKDYDVKHEEHQKKMEEEKVVEQKEAQPEAPAKAMK